MQHFAYIPYRNDEGDEHFPPLHPRKNKITVFQGVNTPFTQKSHLNKKMPQKIIHKRLSISVPILTAFSPEFDRTQFLHSQKYSLCELVSFKSTSHLSDGRHTDFREKCQHNLAREVKKDDSKAENATQGIDSLYSLHTVTNERCSRSSSFTFMFIAIRS